MNKYAGQGSTADHYDGNDRAFERLVMCVRKNAYPDKVAVRRARKRYQRARGVKLRAYQCPHCHAYHLTSRPEWPA